MAERKSLVESLQVGVDPELLEDFVYDRKPNRNPPREPAPPVSAPAVGKGHILSRNTRVPIGVRLRPDYAEILKRASLQRQLEGVAPNTFQDIIEEALEPWFRANGYLQ